MNFNTVDLQQKLQQIKVADTGLLEEVNALLKEEEEVESAILNRIKRGSITGEDFQASSPLKEERVYTLEQIRKLCIIYRLRFLDSKAFKGEIPYEAIRKIKKLEQQWGLELNNFKIVAPKKLFHLEDKNSDPLLFVQLSENRFYFIHKWGGEINAFRALLAFPLRSFMNMFWFLVGVAFVFSLLIPTASIDVFAFLFVHSFIAICGLTSMLVFSLRENFSNIEWDSKYLS
jgi:hypothetical protein